MPRIMFDSVTARDIPLDAQMVAGYINGTYKWTDADWARFPNAVKVRIATQANVNDGHVLDVEPGDATPAQAPGWVVKRRQAGVDPTVYCNELNGWQAVRQAFRDQGVPEPHYWVARYNNMRVIPHEAIARQFINPPLSGGHYDLSIVADYWPGVDGGNMADSVDVQVAVWRLWDLIRMLHTSNDPASPNIPGYRDQPVQLVRTIDDLAWRVHSALQLLEVTAGGTDAIAGKEALPFVTSFKSLVVSVEAMRHELEALTMQVTTLVNNGVTLKAEGQIIVKPA